MLFNRFHDEIYRFATRRLGDPVSGQEVAADTLADAFANLPRFRWRGAPFEAWLYTIARRRIADQLRARARSAPVETVPDAPVADHAAASTDAIQMRALLSTLPDADRTVLELRFIEDLDVDQTARRLGKSEGAVRVATHRALMRLRTAFAGGLR